MTDEHKPTDEHNADPQTGADPSAAPTDPEAELLEAAMSAVEEVKSGAAQPESAPASAAQPSGAQAFDLPPLERVPLADEPRGINLLDDVNLDVKIELGRTMMYVEDVLRLREGAVVELDKLAGDPVDIYVNERLVARGEVLVLNDNFCVRINEIIDPQVVEKMRKTA